LPGELPDAAGLVGAMNANVDPGEPNCFAGGRHAPDVPELGQGDQGDQLPDP
jgi:hypothetical protein